MHKELTAEERARLEERYPRRRATDALVPVAVGLMVVAAVAIVIASGLVRSNPPVAAMVRAFDVSDPDVAKVEVVVQRRDPATPVVCFMYAQAKSFERVGEMDLHVPPGTKELTVVHAELRTVREATAVTLERCRTVE